MCDVVCGKEAREDIADQASQAVDAENVETGTRSERNREVWEEILPVIDAHVVFQLGSVIGGNSTQSAKHNRCPGWNKA